ncbi:MAG: diacylglycerol kinase family protein [Methylococcales bacterium]|nr:diacylglycerol kinase family protein [Methylococcales bacterium]
MTEPANFSRLGVLLNPNSGNMRKNLHTLRGQFKALNATLYREAWDNQSLTETLTELASARLDALIIAGGDGTIQASIDYLAKHVPSKHWPALMLFPGGTTNMTCGDLGLKGATDQAFTRLKTLLENSASANITSRPALAIVTEQTVHGFFLGLGLIARGVEFSRGQVKGMGLTGRLFSVLIALRSLVGLLAGRDDPAWQPSQLAFVHDKLPKGRYLLGLVSTLRTLEFGLTPFWGSEPFELHATFIEQPPKQIWRRLWPLARGKSCPDDAALGYHSFNATELTLTLDEGFIVDGESYQAHGALTISLTEPFRFVN